MRCHCLFSLFRKPMAHQMDREINLEESVESYTVIKHLLPIVRYMDIYDEHNRQRMIEMIKWALSSAEIPSSYVEHLMKLLVHLESNNVGFCGYGGGDRDIDCVCVYCRRRSAI